MERMAYIGASGAGEALDPDSRQPSASVDPDEATQVFDCDMISWLQVYGHNILLPTNDVQDKGGSLHMAPKSKPQWNAQSVLEWVESLAAAAEAKEDDPIVVNGVRLSDLSFPPVASLFPERSRSAVLTMHGDRSECMDFDDMRNRDPGGWPSLQQIETMMSLTEQNPVLHDSCRLIHIRFKNTFHRILEPSKTVNNGTREALDVLYHDTILKLQVQLDSVTKENESMFQAPIKKDFTDVMTNWLLNNWINPYPDDQGIAELAAETETTPTVVGNWLINARTRKWRPAIVKASKHMDRPATLLLEDSINIFCGKPLRKLAAGTFNELMMNHYSDYDGDQHLPMDKAKTFYPPNKRFKPSI